MDLFVLPELLPPPEYLCTSMYMWTSFGPYKEFLFNKRYIHFCVPKQWFTVLLRALRKLLRLVYTCLEHTRKIWTWTAPQRARTNLYTTHRHAFHHIHKIIYRLFFSTLTCINFLTYDTRYPTEKETGDFNIFLFLWKKKLIKQQQHNDTDSCLIPWLMRWSERHPPPIPDGTAVNHGTMLYTHPCTNSRVGEKHESVFLKNLFSVV